MGQNTEIVTAPVSDAAHNWINSGSADPSLTRVRKGETT